MAGCCGGGATKLLYACSGAADVGEVSDKVARKLAREGFGRMTCLAAIGAHLSGFIESARAASENIVIDGCPVACGRKAFEHIGVPAVAFNLVDLGLSKGSTPASDEVVEAVAQTIRKKSNVKPDGAKPSEGTGGCCCG